MHSRTLGVRLFLRPGEAHLVVRRIRRGDGGTTPFSWGAGQNRREGPWNASHAFGLWGTAPGVRKRIGM